MKSGAKVGDKAAEESAEESARTKRFKRNPGERRRSLSAKLEWWLRRNYVDSHHFIIKPTGAHRRGGMPAEDDDN